MKLPAQVPTNYRHLRRCEDAWQLQQLLLRQLLPPLQQLRRARPQA